MQEFDYFFEEIIPSIPFFFCIFAPSFARDSRHIETTKRYARLANGNVGNFQ
jgi:hypothetical protein